MPRLVFAQIAAACLLAGCQSMPHDGPSAKLVEEAAIPDGDYAVVDLDYRVSQLVAGQPPRVLTSLTGSSSAAPIDLIGLGDVLSVWTSQAGSGPLLTTGEAPRTGDGTASPLLTVDRDGQIPAPFAGQVTVAGLTPAQASEAIRSALVGKVMNPQVVVSVAANVANSVTVMGEVRNAGRFPLSANSDRLMDILALAGGPTRPSADVEVTLIRGERSASTTMQAVLADPAENVRLAPRDQIRLSYKPRKFSTFGALARASQMAIEDESLSLAAAISRMGGLDPTRADAASVLVFRFERPEVAQVLGVTTRAAPSGVPVIYRLNLREPSGYFIANSFEIRDGDLVYAPQSSSAELRAFFELVSSVTRVAYDIAVTQGLN